MSSLSISRRDARRSALSGVIDYAGLFPPAELDMATAVAEYRDARTGPQGWIVDRFVCPASRLEELMGVLVPTMFGGEEPWRLAVTASPGWLDSLTADAGAVRTFKDSVGKAATIDTFEIKVPDHTARDLTALRADARKVLRAFAAMVFFELPWEGGVGPAMDALGMVRMEEGHALGVKIRFGGPRATDFPITEDAVRFLLDAASRSLPLKATAGLHHPFRNVDPDDGFHHHGFLNLLTAAAFAHRGEPKETVSMALADEDHGAFTLDKGGLVWRGRRILADELEALRSDLIVGFGSCSFDEPVEDLTALGVLPVRS